MKRMRLVLVLVGVLLLLSLAIFLLTREEALQEAEVQAEYALTGHTAEQLDAIHIQNEYADFTVQRTADGYVIDTASGLPLDSEKLTAFIRRVAGLKAYTRVEAHAQDLSAYQLDAPVARADWTFADGETASVEFGLSTSQGTYARVVDDDAVYLLGGGQMSDFLKDPRSFISTQVTGSTIGVLFDRVTFGGAMRPAEIVVVPNPERELSGVDYRMTEPKEKPTAKAAGILSSLSNLYSIEIAELYPDESMLEKYGLGDDAWCSIVIEYGAAKLMLTASAPTPNGFFYLMTSEYPIIYYMSTSAALENDMPLYWYAVQYQDFLSAYIFHPVYEHLGGMDVQIGETSFSFDIARDNDQVSPSIAGKALDADAFYRYFKVLGTLPNNGYNEASPTGALLMRIVYRYTDGRPDDVLEFTERDARWMICAVNNDAEYLIERSYVDTVYQASEEMAGQE